MRLTPLQEVRERFGSRAALIDAIVSLLDVTDEDTRSRLQGTTNRKLLRIHATAQEVRDRFGGRKALMEEILRIRYPHGKPDDGFLRRLEEASPKRLLEMHRQESARAASKQVASA